jgi:hypothetical protein
MVKLSEADLREMLERRASAFHPDPRPSERTLGRGRRRKARNVVLASVSALVVIALAGLSVTADPGSDRVIDSAGGDPASGAPPPAYGGGALRLVDYAVRVPPADGEQGHPETGPTTTLHDIRRHARCMRSQGFEVPRPTKQPGGGWSVIVHPDKARDLSFSSREFRVAWFVTCGPLGGPLSGDLVIGGPRPKVDRFLSCMERQGFRLPEPVRDRSGHYDSDHWQFDLTRTSIDTSTSAWNRAMFVTCSPEDL